MTNPAPTSNDLDLLMSIDPLDLTKDDLSKIVAYHRNLRAEREAGKGKAVRARNAAAAGGPKLDIAKLLGSMVIPTPQGGNIIRRRT